MLRYSILFIFIFIFSIYAFKDWFKSLCGLVFLMSVMERADMPRGMLGIPGFNPYNILLFFVIIGWLISKNKEPHNFKMPGLVKFLLVSYGLIVVISIGRFLFGESPFPIPGISGAGYVIMNYIINSLKYVIPGLLICVGCHDDKRARFVAYTLMAAFFLLALQTISRMGFSNITDAYALQKKAARILGKTPGFFRVDLAAIMAAAVWTFFCANLLFHKKRLRQLMCLGGSGICLLALMLTGGRTGYGTCILLGLFFSFCRWRVLLFIGPAALACLLAFVPAARDRLLEGFDESTEQNTEHMDAEVDGGLYAITSGRTVVWPIAIDAILKAPLFGYGFNGWYKIGGHIKIIEITGSFWAHPHNAYLEFTLNNGILGILIVLSFFFFVLLKALKLFYSKDSLEVFIGGISIAAVSAYLISALGALSFYPKPSTVFMWCTIGLTLRYTYSPPKQTAIYLK